MGTKEDVSKLFDALCEPNKYGITSIKLDRNSIYLVKGTVFPLWEAKGETDKMPERGDEDNFIDWVFIFPAVSVYLSIFCNDGNDVVFISSNRHRIMHEVIRKTKNEYDKLIKKLFFYEWKILNNIPKSITITKAMCLEVEKENSFMSNYVRDKLKTVELYLKMVKLYGPTLKYVPDEFKTAKLCLEAIKQNSHALEYVPDELKTMELCLIAVKNNGITLEFVPDELKTTELCLEAAKHRKGYSNPFIFGSKTENTVLNYVPVQIKTTKFYLEVVKERGCTLKYIPDELKTAEMCIAAVEQNGCAFNYVPKKFILPVLDATMFVPKSE
jgi:hypothetical protein